MKKLLVALISLGLISFAALAEDPNFVWGTPPLMGAGGGGGSSAVAALACQLSGDANCDMTGAFWAADGSETDPSYTYGTDTGTGWWLAGSSDVKLSVNAVTFLEAAFVSGGNQFLFTGTASEASLDGVENLQAVNLDFTDIGNTDWGSMQITSHDADNADASFINFLRTRGTHAAPTAVTNGSVLGALFFSGQGDTTPGDWLFAAGILATATENFVFATTDAGTRLEFQNTPNGSATLTTRMVIDQNGRVQIGSDTTPDHFLTVTAGTLGNAVSATQITGTLGTAPTGRRTGFDVQITGAGAADPTISAASFDLGAGYTGAGTTTGLIVTNATVGTGTASLFAGDHCHGGTGVLACNIGTWNEAYGSGAVTNVGAQNTGVLGSVSAGAYNQVGNSTLASNGVRVNSTNYGSVNSVTVAKNAGSTTEKHIGAVGIALNGDTNVGLFAGLMATVPTWVSAAFLADNGATTSPILLGRDNGTTVFSILDGGNITQTAVASATTMHAITSPDGQTGSYFTIEAEDDTTPRFSVVPNGTSGSMQFAYRPINTGAGADLLQLGTSGQVSVQILTSGVLQFAIGYTSLGSAIFSGVTDDITTVSSQDLQLHPNGTGITRLFGGTNSGADVVSVSFGNGGGSGSNDLQIVTNSANGSIGLIRSGNGTGGTLRISTQGATLGDAANIAVTGVVATIGDNGISTATGGTTLFAVYGGGMTKYASPQAVTCPDSGTGAAGTLNLDPQSSYIALTNADADGCVVTMQETTASSTGPGSVFTLTVVSNAGGTVTFPDVANVWAAPALLDTTGLGIDGAFNAVYSDKANDMWVSVGSSAN